MEKRKKESRSERMKMSGEKSRESVSFMANLKKYPAGFYVLIAGGLWALIELIMAILHFF